MKLRSILHVFFVMNSDMHKYDVVIHAYCGKKGTPKTLRKLRKRQPSASISNRPADHHLRLQKSQTRRRYTHSELI